MPWSSGDSLNSRNLNNMGGLLHNVVAHGAVGTGSVSDYSSMQSAIDAAEATGGIAYFPSPTSVYATHKRLVVDSSNVILAGDNSGKAIVRLTSATTDCLAIKAGNTEIRHLSFHGPGRSTTTSRGITIDDETGTAPTLYNTRIYDVNVESFGSDGIYAGKPELLSLEHVNSKWNGGRGLLIDNAGVAGAGINNRVMMSRFVQNDGDYQVHFNAVENTTTIGMQCLGYSAQSNQTLCRVQNCNQFFDLSNDYEKGNCGIRLGGNDNVLIGSYFGEVTWGVNVENNANTAPATINNVRAASTVSRLLVTSANASVVMGPRATSAALADQLNTSSHVIGLQPVAPVASTATGFQGQISWGASSGETYLYTCTSANSWCRVAVNPW